MSLVLIFSSFMYFSNFWFHFPRYFVWLFPLERQRPHVHGPHDLPLVKSSLWVVDHQCLLLFLSSSLWNHFPDTMLIKPQSSQEDMPSGSKGVWLSVCSKVWAVTDGFKCVRLLGLSSIEWNWPPSSDGIIGARTSMRRRRCSGVFGFTSIKRYP